MCGIVGFITEQEKIGEADRGKFLKQALIVDSLRGMDSTGVFAVGHEPEFEDGTPWWYKQLGTGAEFVTSKDYWETLYDLEKYRCVVGHNRAATMGSVSADNAHPFQEGPITLVHNGTLRSTYMLPNPMAGLPDVDVDSHAICYNLAHNTVEDVVSKLYGAFALVWHDARDDSINVVRNSERPLNFGLGQNGKTLFFMSEGSMLHMLDERIKLGLRAIYYPNEGQHLKWLPDTPVASPIVKELDLYTHDVWQGYTKYGAYGGYDGYGDSGWDTYAAQSRTTRLYPKSESRQQKTSEKEDWIAVGGTRKPIPMTVQEAMLAFDVLPEDRLTFTPQHVGVNPNGKDRNYVTGVVEGIHKGIIYSCYSPLINGAMDRDWVVRCAGVKITCLGEPYLILKLVTTYRNPTMVSNSLGAHTERSLAYDRVPGADGSMVTAEEFKRDTADGCVMCTAPIALQDAYDLVWTSDGPICPNCDDRLYEPRSYQ